MSGTTRPGPGGPVIGIVGHGYLVQRPRVELPVTGTPRWYVDRTAAAGGRPVVLPAGRAGDLLDLVDALVLTGGADLDPATYGGEPGSALEVDTERDEAELALVRAAAESRIPLLGVCRGMQVLAVAFGGTLVPDLGTTHGLPGTGHPVRCAPGSLVGRLLGPEPRTTSLHHQAVADPGPRWRVTARAADGVAEAIEWAGPDEWQVLGVQWHPELPGDGTGARLFRWLVATVSNRPLNALLTRYSR